MRKPLINPGIIKRLKSFFAIIQDTDTATRYIPAGKYVLYKNIACHASQNIESGDTLALGTNLVTDSDGFVNCLNDGLGTKVSTSDIVNALTSTDSTKPLSAAQGKVLNDSLTTLNSKLNSNANITNDILADAVSTNGTKFFNGSGSSYTGDVPNINYGYGVFTVMKRWSNKFVIAHSPENEIAINYYNGSSWLGWQQIASNSKVSGTYTPTLPDTDTTVYGDCAYAKTGNVVTVWFSFKVTNATLGEPKTIGLNLPAGMKPSYSTSGVCSDGTATGYADYVLNSNGRLSVYCAKAGTTYLIGHCTYVV